MEEIEDVEEHERLLKSIASLGRGRRRKKRAVKRDAEEGGAGVDLDSLIGSISEEKNLNQLKNQLTVTDKRSKVLRAPLHRQQREKLERNIAYDQVSSEVQKWEDIIKQNRVAESLEFPLNQIPYRIRDVSETVEEHFTDPYTEAEKELLRAMSLKEAKARTAEIQKARALMSYRESKFRQQKKIKSKRYHRLIKKQQRRQMLKELEELRTRDPDAAREKLELLEKDRILERATLKHRGTNAWSKQLRMHSKRDPKTREILQEQLRFGRELKEKHQDGSDQSDSGSPEANKTGKQRPVEELLEEDEELADQFLGFSKNNPWIRRNLGSIRDSPSEPVLLEESAADPGKDGDVGTTEEVEPAADPGKVESAADPGKDGDVGTTEEVEPASSEDPRLEKLKEARSETPEPLFPPKKKKKKKKGKSRKQSATAEEMSLSESADIDKLFDRLDSTIETSVISLYDRQDTTPISSKNSKKLLERNEAKKKKDVAVKEGGINKEHDVMINPKDYLKVLKRPRVEISSQLIEVMDEEEDERREEQGDLVAEAFADDDVVGDFQTEKDELEEDERPKDIDLTLPGWGEWAGHGITPSSKRKKFVIKAPKAAPRKDKMKPGVIISEKEDTTIKKFQVSQPPFPFSSVDEFEASIRHPIGKEWNPETALAVLIQPRISTKRGQTILPMDKESTLKKNASIKWDSDDDGL